MQAGNAAEPANDGLSAHSLVNFLKASQARRRESKSLVVVDRATRARVVQIFEEIDRDGSGFLTSKELEEYISGSSVATETLVKNILQNAIKHADQDDDGMLDIEEFMDLFVMHEPHFFDKHHRRIQYFLCVVYFALAPCLYIPYNPNEDGSHWTVSDALYFSVVTVTTVGYGDFGPSNDAMKMVTVFYILFGLTIVASVVNDCVGAIVTIYNAKLEKVNDMIMGGMETAAKAAGEASARIGEKVGWDDTPPATPNAANTDSKKGNKITENIDTASLKKLWFSVLLFATPVLIGTIFFKFNEDWSYIDSFYWSVVTCTTVGYGDMSLEQESSRTFSIFFILIGFGCVGAAIGNVGAIQVERAIEMKKREFLKTSLSANLLKEMDVDNTGVDRAEFLCAMLLQLGKCSEEDLLQILTKFDELDLDNSGHLTKDDLKLLRQRKAKQRLVTGNTKNLSGVLPSNRSMTRSRSTPVRGFQGI